jgi:hypothetical protein
MFPEHIRHLALLAASVLLALWTVAGFGREQIAHAECAEWTDALGQIRAAVGQAAATSAGRSQAGSALTAAVPCVSTGAWAPPGSTLQTSIPGGPFGSDPNTQATTSYRLCRPPDPQIAPAIEQLIAGRSFSLALTAGAGECAELRIAVQPGGVASGRQVSNVSVGLGGNGRISIQIISENGSTSVTIGAA